MKKLTLSTFLVTVQITWAALAMAQQANSGSDMNDGPYIFLKEDSLVAKWIAAGELRNETLQPGKPLPMENGVSASFRPDILRFEADFQLSPVTHYKGIEHIAVIADPHGQYGVFAQLLQANSVIDENLNWAFGAGHLVVLGDVFSRGEEVVDIFWLILKMEKQAELTGGKVHFLIGNHELMALGNDLRYMHKKYRYTMALTSKNYPDLFGPDTYLGRWLRTRQVAVSINGIVFVHAGFSKPGLDLRLSLADINSIFQERIIDRTEEEILADPIASLLSSEWGPVWYRGYFEPTFGVEEAYDIARRLKAKHIIVGHTSFPQVKAFHNRKIIAADSSIKTGEMGEMLFIHKKKFERGDLKGNRIGLR